MTLLFIRLFFLIITAIVGSFIGSLYLQPFIGALWGFISGLFLILIEARMKHVSVRGLSSMVFGLLLGVFMAKLVADVMSLLPLDEHVHALVRVVLTLVFSYLGAVMALRGKDEFNLIIPYVRFKRQDIGERIILLDTSALIDGRVKEIYKTHFFDDRLVVPSFVLQELQKLSDVSQPHKRRRGRRGLDMVRMMQEDPLIDVRVHEDNVYHAEDVDSKLVRLAKVMDARICTLDYGLEQVASIQGIQVLNINALVDAARPVYSIGDELQVDLVRDGKEPGQAVGYTEDGTMVIVNQARDRIGSKAGIVVVSLLQTGSGKMIFAKLSEHKDQG
ncbi:MAG: PIN/TRAM domain-containing protein [Candidatus Omnitrophota bacterium]